MKILYEIFRLPVQKKRQTGQPTVDDKALTELEKIEPLFKPIFQLIKEYRSLGVFISTFLEVELDWDNRMRCSYGVGMAETFRCTSSTDAFGFGGNLQNIPSGNED
jgi:DNA polymerase I-like protein with 3'-5' exonuclease and polymerase domains